ncbi:LD-carboxypeptidase [Selenomonas sp. KH1T6]|uniref:S66 peptidase family protein n=1 Tax=Selenomonas sp. KH1T6 TaxID=3158784 RepID=UPI0015875942
MRRLFSSAVLGIMLASAPLPVGVAVPDMPVAQAAPRVEETAMVCGYALEPGDTIGVIAPATSSGTDDFGNAIKYLESLGYKVKLAPSCQANYGYLAGPDVMRAADVNNFFRDDEVDAILCLRGGYGSARILDKLDYEAIRQHPKLFIGYSDITAMHVALNQNSHLATLHGPMLTSFRKKASDTDYTRENFARALSGKLYPDDIPLPKDIKLQAIQSGSAEGQIIGGNLSILVSLIGTPYELKGVGAILFIEDVGEETYKIDRMLQQLWQSGLLLRVSGVVVGDFVGAEDDYEEGDFHLDEVLSYYAKLSGKPWLKGVPVGHGKNNLCLPFGSRAVMQSNDDGTAALRIVETPLQMKHKDL